MSEQKKSVFPLITPLLVVFTIWLFFMMLSNRWFLFEQNWFMSVTMAFGSFIAGASSEGGGAVAFPVMTLMYDISPSVARNFSLAIQSVGMTAASFVIIRSKIKIEYHYLIPVTIGGAFGMLLGSYFLTSLFPPAYVKMLFVTFWLSFGLILFYTNELNKRKTVDKLPKMARMEVLILLLIGLIGGGISSLLGSGIDIFSFSYITMRYHLSEKIATPTSVVAMAVNSIVGFLTHLFLIGDFGTTEMNYWLVCIPVVVFGAPLGAYVISKRTRSFISRFLYVIILVQFVGAMLIIHPTGSLLYFSGIVLLAGLLFFFGVLSFSKKR
ncbi:MAG: sulfite exporter TauE/SafE family protein [Flavobacteriales bacterium]|nr:sulfite exporter TauE/SafE family protein [Flavobacteriales bacterium]